MFESFMKFNVLCSSSVCETHMKLYSRTIQRNVNNFYYCRIPVTSMRLYIFNKLNVAENGPVF